MHLCISMLLEIWWSTVRIIHHHRHLYQGLVDWCRLLSDHPSLCCYVSSLPRLRSVVSRSSTHQLFLITGRPVFRATRSMDIHIRVRCVDLAVAGEAQARGPLINIDVSIHTPVRHSKISPHVEVKHICIRYLQYVYQFCTALLLSPRASVRCLLLWHPLWHSGKNYSLKHEWRCVFIYVRAHVEQKGTRVRGQRWEPLFTCTAARLVWSWERFLSSGGDFSSLLRWWFLCGAFSLWEGIAGLLSFPTRPLCPPSLDRLTRHHSDDYCRRHHRLFFSPLPPARSPAKEKQTNQHTRVRGVTSRSIQSWRNNERECLCSTREHRSTRSHPLPARTPRHTTHQGMFNN